MPDKAKLESEFVKAVESDDNDAAKLVLSQIEGVQTKDTQSKGDTVVISKSMLGIGEFVSALPALSVDEIDALLIDEVEDDRDPATLTPEQLAAKEDLAVMLIPGVSILDAEHRIHLTQRGDVKRAARGLAIAAVGGVDLEARVIKSSSGTVHTIEDGTCYALLETSQANFDGSVTKITNREECKGHLKYDKTEKGWKLAGGSHLQCLHQHSLMFQLGFFVTASKATFFDTGVVMSEIAQRVGDKDARAVSAELIAGWVNNSNERRVVRTSFAQAITARKNELGLPDNSFLPPSTEIGGLVLPTGETVTQAVINLKGRQFALMVRLPMDGSTVDVTTRTVKNMRELSSAVAPHFAVARQVEGGELLAVEVLLR